MPYFNVFLIFVKFSKNKYLILFFNSLYHNNFNLQKLKNLLFSLHLIYEKAHSQVSFFRYGIYFLPFAVMQYEIPGLGRSWRPAENL